MRNVVDGMDMPTDDMIVDSYAEGAAGFLGGEAAIHNFVTSLLLPPALGQLFHDDALHQSKGDESLIGRKVQGLKRQNKSGTLLEDIRGLSILRAHYEGGRDNRGWEAST